VQDDALNEADLSLNRAEDLFMDMARKPHLVGHPYDFHMINPGSRTRTRIHELDPHRERPDVRRRSKNLVDQLQYEAQQTSEYQKYCLTAVVHPSGVPQSYTYGTGTLAGLLVSIEEAAGRLLTFNYGVGPVCSLVNSIEDWGGRLWSFVYDANANLTAFTSPTGCETQYTYLANGSAPTTLIATIEDPTGFSVGYGYDSSNRVVTMTLGPATYSYSYGSTYQVMGRRRAL
jgi:YD repeat-containing protein